MTLSSWRRFDFANLRNNNKLWKLKGPHFAAKLHLATKVCTMQLYMLSRIGFRVMYDQKCNWGFCFSFFFLQLLPLMPLQSSCKTGSLLWQKLGFVNRIITTRSKLSRPFFPPLCYSMTYVHNILCEICFERKGVGTTGYTTWLISTCSISLWNTRRWLCSISHLNPLNASPAFTYLI